MNVQNFDNFEKLDFYEKEIISYPTKFNTLEFLNEYNGKDKYVWEEHYEFLKKRTLYVEKQIKEFAKENRDLIILWISHGFVTEIFRERDGIDPGYYNYGSVNRYEWSALK